MVPAKAMIIKSIVVGPNEANCYILGCDRTKEAVIIDPGSETARIKDAIRQAGVLPRFIVNTHGHADHIAANRELALPVMIHRLDSEYLKSPYKNMSVFFGFWVTSPMPERLLEDGDRIKIGDLVLEVIHTPGHTPGSICLRADSVVFTGDTLFAGGVGRTDLVGSSEKALFDSIKKRLLVLGDDVTIYPGHGPASTIGEEKKNNPFL
jgi:glyoxylase-like metal-dependent hydrolase (beta-lactamase superfamily II)